MQTAASLKKKRIWLKVLIGVALCLGLAWGYTLWQQQRDEDRLAAWMTRLSAEDPHWEWDELMARRASIPEGKNAADVVVDVLTMTTMRETIGNKIPWYRELWGTYESAQVADYEYFMRMHPNAPAPAAFQTWIRNKVRSEPGAQAVAKLLDIRHLATGRYSLGFRTLLIETLLPDIQGARSMANLLWWDSLVHTGDGNLAQAWINTQAMLGVGRSLSDDPFLISQLVSYAIVNMARGNVQHLLAQADQHPEATLTALQSEFQQIEKQALTMDHLMRLERAVIHEDLKRLHQGKASLSDLLTRGWPLSIGMVTPGWPRIDRFLKQNVPTLCLSAGIRPGSWAAERAKVLEYFQPLIAWGRLPEHQLMGQLKSLADQGCTLRGFPAAILGFGIIEEKPELSCFDQFSRFTVPYLNHRANIRSTVTALACERYRQKHNQWPGKLEQLVPEFLPSVPNDPFTGKPFLLKTLPDGIIIYSIGKNEIDEDGFVLPTKEKQEQDAGVRLWNPGKRRVEMNKECEAYVKENAERAPPK